MQAYPNDEYSGRKLASIGRIARFGLRGYPAQCIPEHMWHSTLYAPSYAGYEWLLNHNSNKG